jgi:uncharacterized protein
MRARTLTGETRAIAERIRSAVLEVEPEAQVILYGSRARGDAAPDSDWDLLILLPGQVDRQREEALVRRLFELELELDVIISAIIYDQEDWATPLRRATPLHQNVTREGIQL